LPKLNFTPYEKSGNSEIDNSPLPSIRHLFGGSDNDSQCQSTMKKFLNEVQANRKSSFFNMTEKKEESQIKNPNKPSFF
jgi:hypothetical protein